MTGLERGGGKGGKVFRGQVFPCRIACFDERDFFFACEVFQVFFAGDGVVDVVEALVVDEAVDFVFLCKAVGFSCAVLPDACQQIVGYPDVNGSRPAGEDVDVILVVPHFL
jgi:hypothetical protein